MAFDRHKVMDWVRENTRVGATAQSSLRSKLYKLPSDATPEDVFACVAEKMRAVSEYPDRRKVLDEWRRQRIAW